MIFAWSCLLAELADRSNGSSLMLPLSNRTREENHKLVNGNSGDSADWVFYIFFLFKIHHHSEVFVNI